MTRRQKMGAALAGALVLGVIAVAFAGPRYALIPPSRPLEPAPPRVVDRPADRWPGAAAPLRAVDVRFPKGFGTKKIYLDAGHGAPDNTGNRSAFCIDEQEFTLGAVRRLERAMVATKHFEVKVSRVAGQLRGYRERVQEAEAWGADAFVSIHSDVRGETEDWEPQPGVTCRRSLDAPGYSVLWSDAGSRAMNDRRVALARALSARLQASGFPFFTGDYEGLYARDVDGAGAPTGVYVDRHDEAERIFVLWKPTMPSVIIETHNAVDPDEARRWEEDRTFEVFEAAVVAGLVDALVR